MMPDEEKATKITQLIERADGSQIKICAQTFFGAGLQASTDVYALRREGPDAPWKLLSNRPHPNWREMSVDEYTKNGRSELLQALSPGEILKVTSLLGRPMSEFADAEIQAKCGEWIESGGAGEIDVCHVERPRCR